LKPLRGKYWTVSTIEPGALETADAADAPTDPARAASKTPMPVQMSSEANTQPMALNLFMILSPSVFPSSNRVETNGLTLERGRRNSTNHHNLACRPSPGARKF
jgi:hypothetical protein